MLSWIKRYTHWLHTRWPAGTVEKLPAVREDGSTRVPGLYVVGDLTGVPLLKFSADGGTRAVRTILQDPAFQSARLEESAPSTLDLVIVGAGVSGMAAALEAEKAGLDFRIVEAIEPFSTILNFPKGKPIYAYPTEMTPAGALQFTAEVKEPLVEELKAQTLDHGFEPLRARAEKVQRGGSVLEVVIPDRAALRARRVIVAIGRSGNFRKLGVPGEELSHKVQNRLHDPQDFCDQAVLVVGGGDSALETAIAIAGCGGRVTLSYRKREFARPKPENVAKLEELRKDPGDVDPPLSDDAASAASDGASPRHHRGHVDLMLGSEVETIDEETVCVRNADGATVTLRNDAVFTMIGREPPLDFFRRSGVPIRGETTAFGWTLVGLFLLVVAALYDWKSGGFLAEHLKLDGLSAAIASWGQGWAAQVADRSTLIGTVAVSARQPAFWFTLLYTLTIGVFAIRRIKLRKTPYVKVQTTVLFLIQLLPLFLLPEIILPLAGYNGWFDSGLGQSIGEQLFPLYAEGYAAAPEWGHPAAYWRAYGFILAWPLMVWNVMSEAPLAGWLIISVLQTFVLIPLLIWRWGKGAYCGWICSCGALAETLGDGLRQRMPHGPRWNRLNMVGQVILLVAVIMALVRIIGWIWPTSGAAALADSILQGGTLSYKWLVDFLLAGVLGTGLYIKFSGRVWCRFACPLAALMHVYARFSRFAIVAEKKKCISCNVCTSVCHQGIDVMNFANKGRPMIDPECVRCSACVQSCPTGVLEFGQIDRRSGETTRKDSLAASPVFMAERSAE